jgi:outer membrane protein assembly factor BamA
MIDYSRTYQVDRKNSIAWHVGGGLIYPYGNSKQTPVQKRFFSGGANSVRGWAIRELGPGSYYFVPSSATDRDNFYYHSGDIRFDASIEYRSKLFWIIELGAFVDAGNIWTIKNYAEQPRGKFRPDRFYREIAAAWGLGLRLDFDFVLLRLDGGWKAYNPSADPQRTKWPVVNPFNMNDNFAWHIAVGYPF